MLNQLNLYFQQNLNEHNRDPDKWLETVPTTFQGLEFDGSL